MTFREALLKGQAPDRGLYLPQTIPTVSADELARFAHSSYADIAYTVTRKFLHSEIPDAELRAIVDDAYNFPVPLEHVTAGHYVMRLDQGPTASFKDFAARMMGRVMQYFLKQDNQQLLILTATSGDTGSAIANAFYGLDNIRVLILFPVAEVTERQRKQMTTLQKNIRVLGLDGKFDDCQALVKQAFADRELARLNLSSANSINIGRLLPQMIYYFYAYAQLCRVENGEEIIFAVPSGNFGDVMGGLLAQAMGLPVKKFVVATNANDAFPTFLQTGRYEKIAPSRNCLSSAMNVGHPSNVARVIALYGGHMDEQGNIRQMPDLARLRQTIYAVGISDELTKATMQAVYETHHVLLEPHGAVAWAGLQQYVQEVPPAAAQICVALETAHPAKFAHEMQTIIGVDPALPPSLEGLEGLPETFRPISSAYAEFKQYLDANY